MFVTHETNKKDVCEMLLYDLNGKNENNFNSRSLVDVLFFKLVYFFHSFFLFPLPDSMALVVLYTLSLCCDYDIIMSYEQD